MTGYTSGAGTTNHSGAIEFISSLVWFVLFNFNLMCNVLSIIDFLSSLLFLPTCLSSLINGLLLPFLVSPNTSCDFERTWWRLFWAYLMKVITYLMKVITYLMKIILSVPDEGYFERTWWRLFWAYTMKVITYLMKVIPDMRRAYLIWYLRFCYWVDKRLC